MTSQGETIPVLVVAGEGGSISLVRQSVPDGQFALITQEIDYGLDDVESTKEPPQRWLNWDKALDALEAYPWRSLTPIRVSAMHAEMLQAAYRNRPASRHSGDNWDRLFSQTGSILAGERNLHE